MLSYAPSNTRKSSLMVDGEKLFFIRPRLSDRLVRYGNSNSNGVKGRLARIIIKKKDIIDFGKKWI